MLRKLIVNLALVTVILITLSSEANAEEQGMYSDVYQMNSEDRWYEESMNVPAVPEPATWATGALAAAIIAWGIWRGRVTRRQPTR